MNIYDIRRYGTLIFLLIALAVVSVFLYYSNSLVKDLATQERSRMQIWADATKEVATIGYTDTDGSHIDFLLSIIEGNTNIPVLLTDDEDNIIMHRNFRLPEPIDSMRPLYISEANAKFLYDKLSKLRGTANVIHIVIEQGNTQHLYYEDSNLLKSLSLYPYIQLVVMIAFIMVVYFAVTSLKKAEQNKVWVGLSKETAWMELLEGMGVEPDVVHEMDKDVKRLSTIASRFSKIGSRPSMEPDDFNSLIQRSVEYMTSRISSRVKLWVSPCSDQLPVNVSTPLVEWVMENIIKNAVDAMEGSGEIHITTFVDKQMATAEIRDTGKGMSRKHFKTVFNPGFTTKKRGWGLGLTLAKRIVEQYHGGRIFVKDSEPGHGTTFRVEFPLNLQTNK